MAKRSRRLPQPWKPKKIRGENSKVDNSKFYQSKRWRKVRAMYVAENPLCVACEKRGLTTAVQEVDHVIPLRFGGAEYDFSNLQSLCKSCHGRKSGKEAHL
jgi:5-methylcytosine-specific restriction protein A